MNFAGINLSVLCLSLRVCFKPLIMTSGGTISYLTSFILCFFFSVNLRTQRKERNSFLYKQMKARPLLDILAIAAHTSEENSASTF